MPATFERTLSSTQEKKTKGFVELTSRNNADKIIEEDSEDELISQQLDTDEDVDVYNDLRAISIASLQ